MTAVSEGGLSWCRNELPPSFSRSVLGRHFAHRLELLVLRNDQVLCCRVDPRVVDAAVKFGGCYGFRLGCFWFFWCVAVGDFFAENSFAVIFSFSFPSLDAVKCEDVNADAETAASHRGANNRSYRTIIKWLPAFFDFAV